MLVDQPWKERSEFRLPEVHRGTFVGRINATGEVFEQDVVVSDREAWYASARSKDKAWSVIESGNVIIAMKTIG